MLKVRESYGVVPGPAVGRSRPHLRYETRRAPQQRSGPIPVDANSAAGRSTTETGRGGTPGLTCVWLGPYRGTVAGTRQVVGCPRSARPMRLTVTDRTLMVASSQ
jgi:hypothetical protein